MVHAIKNSNNLDILVALIEGGADVNARDVNGMTPMMYAAHYNDCPDVITILKNAGADVNARDENGWTALMFAADYNNNPDVIMTLLEAGANPKMINLFYLKKAIEYIDEDNPLYGTEAYWKLWDASF